MLLDDFGERRLLYPVVREELLKYRGLEDAKPDPQANDNKADRQRKWKEPAPPRELVTGQIAERKDRNVCQEQPQRDAQLWPGCDEAPLAVGTGPFHRQKHGAAPLAAY